jgi:hypothetical protein
MHLLAHLAMLEIQGMTEKPDLKVHKVSLENVGSVVKRGSVVIQVTMASMGLES